MDGETILGVCDILQGLLVDLGMDDVPVVLATPSGGYKSLSEMSFNVETVQDGDGYDAVVIRP